MASATNLLVMAFLVWFSYEVWLENEEETSTRQSSTSWKFILLSFLRYLLFCLR